MEGLGGRMARKSITHEGGPSMRHYRAELVAGILLVALTLAAYGRVCGNDFVNYDDADYVTENRQVQAGLTGESVAWAFTTTHAANWHPLTWLSLELDHQLYGLRPWGYHLTNLLLHTASALVLFLALRRMTGAVGRSAMVAALFAVHPLHVESVAWVSERKDTLSGLFWMVTLLAYAWYAERPGVGRYLLVLAAFALGLLAKPMLVTLPCVLLLLDYWPLGRLRSAANEREAGPSAPRSALFLVLEKLPLFALSAASCAVTVVAQRQAMWSRESLPLPTRCLNALVSCAGYVGKMVYPLDLAALYPYPHSVPVWQLVAAAVFLLSVTGLALWLARRRPYVLVGWLWYLGTLVPVIGLVQVGKQAMADRYTYIPLIGLFLVLVWGTADLFAARPGRRAALAALAALVLVPCAVLTWRQADTWRDALSLWSHAVAATSDNADANINVGRLMEAQGQRERALAFYREALRIDPNEPDAHYSLGLAFQKQGKWPEAVAHLTETLRLKPDHKKVHVALGWSYERQGRWEEARQMYEVALERDPGDVATLNNLGITYLQLGQPEAARRRLTAALAINPNLAPAHDNLGRALLAEGHPDDAVAHLSTALQLEPRNAGTHCNMADALARLGQHDRAIAEYRAALRLQPGLAPARRGLEALHAPAEGP
jgi:tetratricopeptide (TPR) repeat protein